MSYGKMTTFGAIEVGLSAGKSLTGNVQHDEYVASIKKAYADFAAGEKITFPKLAIKAKMNVGTLKSMFKKYPLLLRRLSVSSSHTTD